jgi:hypothetical protein
MFTCIGFLLPLETYLTPLYFPNLICFILAPECPENYKLHVAEKDGRSCFAMSEGEFLMSIISVVNLNILILVRNI